MRDTADLIEQLAAGVKPVQRPRPPLQRAALWLGVFLLVAGSVTGLTGAWPDMIARLRDLRFAAEMGGTLMTGIGAIIAVFFVTLPDRLMTRWQLLPLPFLSLWLATAGFECYRNWIAFGPATSFRIRGSFHCVGIIVGISVPLAAALYLVLRATRPLYPARVMTIGGLGVAGLAATMLQFYHHNDVTILDLGLHMAAVAAVVITMAGLGYWLVHPAGPAPLAAVQRRRG